MVETSLVTHVIVWYNDSKRQLYSAAQQSLPAVSCSHSTNFGFTPGFRSASSKLQQTHFRPV
jgi:hypothetical protein